MFRVYKKKYVLNFEMIMLVHKSIFKMASVSRFFAFFKTCVKMREFISILYYPKW